MHIINLLIATAALINLFAFFMILRDKRASRRGGDTARTPEGLLFFLAAAGGSLGIYAGMLIFRHKTRRWYFQLGIPLLIIQNVATANLLHNLFVEYM